MNDALMTVFEDFLKSYGEARHPSRNTIISMKMIVPKFLRFCSENRNQVNIADIDQNDIIAYLNSTGDLRTSSHATHLRWIMVFLHWLYDPMQLLIEKPKPVHYKGPVDIPRAIQKDFDIKEVQQIFAILPKLSPKEQAMGYLLLHRLLRIGELVNLKIADVNLQGRRITIHKSKNRSSRTISIPMKAYDALKEIIQNKQPQDTVFNLSYRQMTNHVNAILKKSGVQKRGRGSHAFRHSGIESLLEEGVNVAVVAKMAGNTPRTIYDHYAKNISTRAQRDGEIKLDRLRQGKVIE